MGSDISEGDGTREADIPVVETVEVISNRIDRIRSGKKRMGRPPGKMRRKRMWNLVEMYVGRGDYKSAVRVAGKLYTRLQGDHLAGMRRNPEGQKVGEKELNTMALYLEWLRRSVVMDRAKVKVQEGPAFLREDTYFPPMPSEDDGNGGDVHD